MEAFNNGIIDMLLCNYLEKEYKTKNITISTNKSMVFNENDKNDNLIFIDTVDNNIINKYNETNIPYELNVNFNEVIDLLESYNRYNKIEIIFITPLRIKYYKYTDDNITIKLLDSFKQLIKEAKENNHLDILFDIIKNESSKDITLNEAIKNIRYKYRTSNLITNDDSDYSDSFDDNDNMLFTNMLKFSIRELPIELLVETPMTPDFVGRLVYKQ